MSDVKYLIFDIETVGDGDLIRNVRYPNEELTPREAISRYRKQLLDETGKVLGEIRSSALSPRFGGVALGMVRREVPAGTTLQAKWDGGECSVQIEQNEKGAAV